MDKKIFTFLGFLSLSIVILVIDISVSNAVLSSPVKILLLMLVVFLDFLAVSSRYYTYLMLPFVQQRRRNIVLSNDEPYRLSTASDSILHKDGDDYIATVYIKIPLYRSATEMNMEEKIEFTRQISRLIGQNADAVRFSSQMYVMNKDSYIQTLRDTINKEENNEAQLTAKGAPKSQIEKVRGKLSMWHNMLDNVSRTTSLELTTFATVSSRGTKEYEAVSIAQQRAREVMSGVAATFGITPTIVTGDALLKFIEPEYLIPYSTVSEQISKNIREQVS